MQRSTLSTAHLARHSRCRCLSLNNSHLPFPLQSASRTNPLQNTTTASLPIRTFSSTTAVFARPHNTRLNHEHAEIPPYPYGPSRVYKQSNFGLYSSLKIRFGNKVSSEYGNKSRRSWKPNVHHKKLWSTGLQKWIRTKVATRTLRSIDKVGGLDNYLLGGKAQRVKDLGMGGWRLRWLLLRSPWGRQWLKDERARLGLPELPESELLAEKLMGVPSAKDVEGADVDAVVSLDKESESDQSEWVDEDVQKADGAASSPAQSVPPSKVAV